MKKKIFFLEKKMADFQTNVLVFLNEHPLVEINFKIILDLQQFIYVNDTMTEKKLFSKMIEILKSYGAEDDNIRPKLKNFKINTIKCRTVEIKNSDVKTYSQCLNYINDFFSEKVYNKYGLCLQSVYFEENAADTIIVICISEGGNFYDETPSPEHYEDVRDMFDIVYSHIKKSFHVKVGGIGSF